ncbi:Chain length determinant protein [Methylorubrum salsuginis]|uniref:Chain length determinant protein n=2 Tax=Methylorubrum salsuginis TaxID=414703 RepID=A0A1I3YR41_9HYPH|nr:Chain length determinant protein [Methylorubrum salsuginis]
MRAASPRMAARPMARPIWGGERSEEEAWAGIVSTLRLLRSKRVFLALWVAAFVAAGAVYVKLLRPDFVATTQVLLQPRVIINDGPEDVRHFHQFMIDGEQCETELRALRSEQLLYQVFKALNLSEAPESRSGADGLWAYLGAKIRRFERLIEPAADGVPSFYAFANRVRARRLGLSYVIEISYRAQSAKQATRVVNAIAVAYAAHRLRGVLAREKRRGAYLESRVNSLHTQLLAASAGLRLGSIPDGGMPDADVRLLGPAKLPLRSAFPKPAPLLAMLAGLGAMSGLLIVLLPQSVSRPTVRTARIGRPIGPSPERVRIA